FRDGVFLVMLAPISDPDLVASAIAQELRVRELPGRTLTAGLQEALRDKRMLLLLDNFEQVVEAAPVVADLLAAAPGLKVLVTSRAALHLRGEREFSVSPLALPPIVDRGSLMVDRPGGTAPTIPLQPLTISQYASVELFIQRARDVRPEFEVNNE